MDYRVKRVVAAFHDDIKDRLWAVIARKAFPNVFFKGTTTDDGPIRGILGK